MRISFLSSTSILALFAASFAGVSVPAYAGGSGEGAASNQPLPDLEKKVFTNEDLEAKYGKRTPTTEISNSRTIAASAQTTTAAQPAGIARREPLPPEKDPAWYAQQTVSLSNEIASLDDQSQRLIQFRVSDSPPGAGTGLILSAPCEGISTDNEIAQLLARRREIEARIADLEDTARRNDIPPGIFVRADEIAQAAEQQPHLTPAEERAALAERLRQLSDELAETQSVVESMREDTAARHMTLLPPNGYGGNMTTDLLERLAAQSNALKSEINSLEDEALRVGLPARDLP